MKNYKTTACGALIAGATVIQDGGFDVHSWQSWINLVLAVGLFLAKDAGVSGPGL
jgi:hypothetical protein